MSAFFVKLLNISILSVPLVVFVIFYRLVDKKLPKWIRCALWAVVAVRLICPLNIESPIGVAPSVDRAFDTIVGSITPGALEVNISEMNIQKENELEINEPNVDVSDMDVSDKNVSEMNAPVISTSEINISDNYISGHNIAHVLSWIWLTGFAVFTGYFILGTAKMRRKVDSAINIFDNIYICDDINTPFVMGILSPKIYLPSSMDENNKNSVLAHESAHISRFDYIWKPLGFLVVSLHWFNPFCYVAYILFCHDIEYACDEKAVKNMQKEERKSYSEALLTYSIKDYSFIPDRVAFSEASVKRRIKNVRNFKKQAIWAVMAVLAACALAGCALFTHQTAQKEVENTSEILTFTEGFALYTADVEGVVLQPNLLLKNDSTFSFSYDALSSYLSWGYYEITDGMIYCRTSDGQFKYVFDICDDGSLILNGEFSSKVYISSKNLSLAGAKFTFQKLNGINDAYAPANVPTIVTLRDDSEYVHSKWDEESIASANFYWPVFEICVVKDGVHERRGVYNKEKDILVYINSSTGLGIYCGTKYIDIGTGISLVNHVPHALFLDVTGDGNEELIVMCGDSEKSSVFAIDTNKAEVINDFPANIFIGALFSDYALTGYGNYDGNTCVKIKFTLKNGSNGEAWIPVYSNENAAVDLDTISFRFSSAPIDNVVGPEVWEGKTDINSIFSHISVTGVVSINDGLDKRNLANLIVRLDTKYNPESGRIELNSIEEVNVVLREGADWGYTIGKLIDKLPPIDSDTLTGDVSPSYICPILPPYGVTQDIMISSPFGIRSRLDENKFHTGIDIVAEKGTEVMAVAEGKVVSINANEEQGLYVIIKQTDSFYSLYGQLSNVLVSVNDMVSAGMVVGKVGSSGASTGAHLHFSVLGNYMDESGNIILRYVEPIIE